MDLVKTNELVRSVWEFSFDGYRVKCQHIEGPRAVHTVVVSENDVIIERHKFTGDPTDPATLRRLNGIQDALRGIYQARCVRAVRDRRK